MSNARSEWLKTSETQSASDEPIAIVGMSVDLPGAPTINTFWENLRDGVEAIETLDEEALLAAGESPDRLHHKNYVASAARLKAFDEFDAEFFGFSAKEAAILDPQHRKFMEVSWGALENAGHMPETFKGPIGVYAGCGMGSYFYFNLCSNPDLLDDVGMFLLRHTGNDKDFLATRVSHILDLKGPSINIQTACSTSLVAVHYACNALRQGDCDMALAGGVTIELPHGRGYLFKENEILSPDGHCHAFDHRAEGTVFGSGAGCVALRRLSDAQADGDHIWAVIRGSAVNNDGSDKASYLAPSVDGQAQAVAKALDSAGVTADTVDYVECHGTGTYLGDPIEVSAMTEAYRKTTDQTGFCRIGSVKTNIGHLDTAAGVASLVKATLGMHHGQMPPSLNYEAPNPAIDFETSPFRVNDSLRDWDGRGTPRRAGVNSLGVGGTNAHAVIEEAPARPASEESDWPFHVMCISGRSKSALEVNTKALAQHLRANPDQPLADIAWTLKQGRRGFDKRRVVVAETHAEAADLLEAGDTRRVFTHDLLGMAPETVFMFPGGGAQYTHMARDLYEVEPVFAEWMDKGLDHLQAQLDYDIRALWLPDEGEEAAAEARLKQPSVQLPLIMIVEYALAQLWMSWGVKPAALVGHSMGENTAACLAGVMRFEDCIDLVLLRGRLFDTVPKGGMLSVSLPVARLEQLVGDDLDIASVNAPELSAVSGPDDKLAALAKHLEAEEVDYQRVAIDIAAHSRMLDPILGHFRSFLQGLTLKAPTLPVISNRTGAVLTAEQATDPDYWVQQLRNRVEFGACIATLAQTKGRVFLEVGPGKALSALAQMNSDLSPAQVLSSLRHPDQDIADDAYHLGVIGRLWACGVEADWAQIWGEARRNRVPLPGYAFQRKRYFIEPGKAAAVDSTPALLMRNDDITQWGYRPTWRPRFANSTFAADHDLNRTMPQTWAFFMDEVGLAEEVATKLESAGHTVIRIRSGDMTDQAGENTYTLAPEMGREAYENLFAMLAEAGQSPERIAHFWGVTQGESFRPGSNVHARNLEHGVFSLMHIAQALGDEAPVHLSVITNGAEQLRDEALPYPEKAMIAGPAGVIPRELPGVTCATLDIDLPHVAPRRGWRAQADESLGPMALRVLEDLLAEPGNARAVLRGEKRFEQSYEVASLEPVEEAPTYRLGGTYLITGGFGGIGQVVARDLIENFEANVVLLSRSPLPSESDWAEYLNTRGPSDSTAQRIRAMQALSQGKGEVMAASGDICNVVDMAGVKDEIEARFGKLTGLIHAAGAINDAPLLAKEVAEAEAVFAPKVTGLRVLDEVYPDGTLELMLLFASSSTVTRPAGQIDYAAANEYLNAFAKARKTAQTRVVAVNWGVWADVGMAADAMAARTGVGPQEDWRAADQPLLKEQRSEGDVQVYRATLSDADWVIDGHRTSAGDALLPGTGFIELAAEARAAAGQNGAFELRDLHFLRALDVADGQSRAVEVHLHPDGTLEVRSAARVDGREGTVLNAQAQIVPLEDAASQINLTAIRSRCGDAQKAAAGDRLKAPQETHLRFGARWHVLRETRLGDGEGLAHLSLSEACLRDLSDGYLMHPGLLDPATGWAMRLIPGYEGAHLWVPLSYQSFRILRPLPGAVTSWVRLAEHGAGHASFDITLADDAGEVCAEITGFQMQRLEGQVTFGKAAPLTAADVDFDDADAAAALSPEEERLFHNITQGIPADKGPEALRRALALNLPQVVISSLDLDGLVAQAEAATPRDEGDGQSFERPDLDGDYLAPTTPTEEKLAAFWEKLLGVSPVGIDDSFFDLGGHSLIAVRLFAMIKKEFNTQFPISVLFDAPTIAGCAALIDERTGGAGSSEMSETDGKENRKQGFTHLVALGRGDGKRVPLFIVAGMFGNVLNLRHLAQRLGPDQPVYGLQARGLIGDDEPHDTIEAAARDYLAEIRQVQSEGPYLLSGFSGGGITAFEIARQIEAEGGQVNLLAMLDTPLPVRPSLSRRDKVLIKLSELRRKGSGYLREWALNRLQWELEKRNVQGDSGQGFNNHKIEMAFRGAVEAYEVTPWDGRILLFRPPLDRHWKVSGDNWVSAEREYVFEDNQWTQFVPKTQVIEVTGDHDSMVLDPNVAVLARHLSDEIAALAKAGKAAPNPDKDSSISAAE
ncbi:type I polyketide synthase [Roseovarius sp. 2305UL8-3]|uniref:type I polyketide synthase n=1 Tax=Roseovarius conchicola TaxID=3121636 RepID=UPI0035278E1D